MESEDWSAVISEQTQSTLQDTAAGPTAVNDQAATEAVVPEEAAPSSRPGPPREARVTPFAQARVHRSIGEAACLLLWP